MKKLIFCISFLAITFALPTTIYAASQDECAIWLCLPAGFPGGCGGAKSAFKKRIKKGKSPLPSFSSCAVSSPSLPQSKLSYDNYSVKHIGAHRRCVTYSSNGEYCTRHEMIEESYQRGRCHEEYDSYCLGNRRAIDIYIDGSKTGSTYVY